MEGEAFDPNPQASSTPERESKEMEDGNKYQAASNIEFTPDQVQASGGNHSPPPDLEEDTHNDGAIPPSTTSTTSTTWRDKLPEVVRHGAEAVQSTLEATIHHPYVTQGAETVRQGLGQTSGFVGDSVTSAQSRLGPLVNHPYVQKTTETVSSTLQPLMSKSAETMQKGSETAKKIYNREEGYEPSKLAPYFAGSLGIVILCILLAGMFVLLVGASSSSSSPTMCFVFAGLGWVSQNSRRFFCTLWMVCVCVYVRIAEKPKEFGFMCCLTLNPPCR